MKALVVYHTRTGHTEQAALDIARGLEAEGVQYHLESAAELPDNPTFNLDDYQIVLVGSPTYGHTGYRNPAKPVKRFLESIPANGLDGKTCGAFAVNAAMGGRSIVNVIEKALLKRRGRVVSGGPVVKAGAPLSLWKGPPASPDDVHRCEEYGKKVANAA